MIPGEDNRLYVRQARRRDIDEIVATHVRSWRAAYRDILPADFLADMNVPEITLNWEVVIANEELEHEVLVVTCKRAVIGWLSFGGCRDEDATVNSGELYGLYIDPEWWGCGAASALVRRALAVLAEAGYAEVSLWVLEANQRARRFYEWWGFQLDGATSVFARSGWSRPKLRMKRMPTG